MRALRWTLAWFVAEIVALLLVARWIGWAWVLLAFLAGGFAGLLLIRSASASAIRAVAEPGGSRGSVARAGWHFVSGVLIAMPGLLSDVVGLVLLVPIVQNRLGRRFLASPLLAPWAQTRFTATGFASGEVIDGEVIASSIVFEAHGAQGEAPGTGTSAGPQTVRGEIIGRSPDEGP